MLCSLCSLNGLVMIENVKQIAVDLFGCILKASADDNGTFKVLVTAKIGDSAKPLLLVGNAHSRIEDGHCIVVLNPNESLFNDVSAGCVYYGDTLKDIVLGKCDLMLELWIDAYKKDSVVEISRYQSREVKPAKFSIK